MSCEPDKNDPSRLTWIKTRLEAIEEEARFLRSEMYDLQTDEEKARRDLLIQECRNLKRRGLHSEAVRLYRMQTGCGLKEAYMFIQDLK